MLSQALRPRVRPLEQIPLSDESDPEGARFLLRDGAALSSDQLVVGLAALYLIDLCDGTRTPAQVLDAFTRLTEVRLEASLLDNLLSKMDENYLLDNERARARLREISPRPTRHAGGGYPTDPEALRQFLDNLLSSQASPVEGPVRASILPHIDFYRGEEAYRAGYHPLKTGLGAQEDPLTVVILGISHAISHTPFILTHKDFDTPLGIVETDSSLIEELARNLNFDPFRDEYNHMAEHSVEFHAVVLKHLAAQRNLKIVPILCSSFFKAIQGKFSPLELDGVSQFIDNLKRLQKRRPDIHFLASVDLAHMGTQFGGPPLNPEKLDSLESQDLESIGRIQEGCARGFFATHQADGGVRNYCGTPAIYALLEMFPEPFELHRYQQCTDPDLSSTVTVCSMTLR